MENQNEVQQVVSEQPKKKKGKKKWIIIAVVAVLFIAIASSGSSEPTVETSPNGSVAETKEKEEKETEATKDDTQEIKAGSTVNDNYIKIAYKSCNADFKNYSRYADVKSGYKVIQAVFDFENIFLNKLKNIHIVLTNIIFVIVNDNTHNKLICTYSKFNFVIFKFTSNIIQCHQIQIRRIIIRQYNIR
jgi:flagellar basal body-associated protein FliL